MRLLLHAITPKAELDLSSLAAVTDGDLTAWTTTLESDAPFTREDMLTHHRHVLEVFAHVDACLPARFPTIVENQASLRAQLVARRDSLVAQLAGVRGACELAVTAVWTSQEEPVENEGELTPGRRYLLRRAGSERRRAQAEELAQTIEREAGRDLVVARRQVCPSDEIALSSALLVRRANAEAIRFRLERHLAQGIRILVNGPWPPYSFADARSTG